jgi:NADH-ubiquinone oxidoreductase chain 5
MIKPTGYKNVVKNVMDSDFFIGLPLFILAFNSIFFGFIFKDLFIGLGSDT